MLVAIRIWLTILVCWPGAGRPLVDDRLAHRLEQRAASASTTSVSPPIMIESRASRAPTSPPETGASTAWTPLGLRRLEDLDAPAPARWWSCRRATVPGLAPGEDALRRPASPRGRRAG